MSGPRPHPSFLELDRAALGGVTEELRRHLDACDACRDHLERARQPLPIPAWVQDEASRPPRRWRLPVLAGSLAALATATAVAVVTTVAPSSPPAVAAKGEAAVALFVKRGEQVRLWDGASPVRPGDLLRLKVVPEGLSQVLVAVPAPDGGLEALYQGEVPPRGETLLPESWRVDDAEGPEILAIALSAARLDLEQLRAALERPTPRSGLWTTVLTLRKQTTAQKERP